MSITMIANPTLRNCCERKHLTIRQNATKTPLHSVLQTTKLLEERYPRYHMKMRQIGRKRGLLRVSILDEQNVLERNKLRHTAILFNLPPCTALIHINPSYIRAKMSLQRIKHSNAIFCQI